MLEHLFAALSQLQSIRRLHGCTHTERHIPVLHCEQVQEAAQKLQELEQKLQHDDNKSSRSPLVQQRLADLVQERDDALALIDLVAGLQWRGYSSLLQLPRLHSMLPITAILSLANQLLNLLLGLVRQTLLVC